MPEAGAKSEFQQKDAKPVILYLKQKLTDSDAFPLMYGSNTATNTSVSIGTSTTVISAANTNRKVLAITNDSDETIYVSLAATAVLNTGNRLNAYGGVATVKGYYGAVSGICASGGKVVCTSEA